MRDPYALYAKRVLGLRALEPIDAQAEAAVYGSLLHEALARFIATCPSGGLPKDAARRLMEAGREAFRPVSAQPALVAFWWPRFVRIADWFLGVEGVRRAGLVQAHTEIKGELELSGPGGPFTLTARADRIDRRSDGGLVVLDYKSGQVPSAKEVAAGFAPQLPLEAALAAQGRFAGVAGGAIAALEYWKLSGGRPAGKVTEIAGGAEAVTLVADALAGLRELIRRYDDPLTPYPARPRPGHAPRYSDYEHLERIEEWAPGAGGEPE